MLGGSAFAMSVLDCNIGLTGLSRDSYPPPPAPARQAMGLQALGPSKHLTGAAARH